MPRVYRAPAKSFSTTPAISSCPARTVVPGRTCFSPSQGAMVVTRASFAATVLPGWRLLMISGAFSGPLYAIENVLTRGISWIAALPFRLFGLL